MTEYVDLPVEGDNRLTVKEAQALVQLVGVVLPGHSDYAKLNRARTKLLIALNNAPYLERNKRAVARAKRNET